MQTSKIVNHSPVRVPELPARARQLRGAPAVLRAERTTMVESIDAERFRLALMHSAIGVAITDTDGRFVSVNRTFCRITGYSRRELLGRNWLSLTHPADRKRSLALALRLRSGARRSFSLEKRYLTKSGDTVWCRASLSAVPGSSASCIALVEDITRRKQAEANVRRLNLELARRAAALEKERKRWRWVLQAIPDDIWICDLRGRSRVIKVPDPDPLRLRNLQGHSMAQMMRQLEICNPDGRPLALEEAPLLRSLRGETLRGEVRVRNRAGGDTHWRQFASAPIRDDAGAILGSFSVTRDITGQKQALERLQEFQKAMDGVAEMIVVVDREYRYLIANCAFLEAFGLAREQVIGHAIPEVVGAGFFQDTIRPKLDECFRGSVVKFELRYAFPRWSERDLAISYFPVQGQAGIDRAACLLEDITERKQAQAALRESEDRYRDLVENSQDLLCTHDLRGQLLSSNPAPARILGYTVEELLRIPMRDFIVPEHRPEFDAYLSRMRQNGKDEGLLAVMTRSSETRIWEYSNTLRTQGVSEPIVRGIAHDVTERLRAEKALREREARLREYERAVEGLDEMIVVIDRDYRYILMNRAFLRYRGLTREQLIGCFVADVLQPGVFETVLKPRLDECFRGKIVQFEMKYTYPERGERDLFISYFPIAGPAGVDRVVAILRDVTQSKQAEVDVRSLLAIAEKLNSTLEAGELLDALLLEAMKLTGAEIGWSGDRAPEGMVCRSHFRGPAKIPFDYTWPPGAGMPGWVLQHKAPYLVSDAACDPVVLPRLRQRFRIKTGLAVPIIDAEGQVIGFLAVINKKGGGAFTLADVEKLTAVCQAASVALQHALAFQKLKQAEDSLRRLSASLLRSQDEEHRRIARELHDSTSQNLASLVLSLGAIRKTTPRLDRQLRKNLAASLELAKESAREVRSLAYLLHPPMLDEFGLADALRWYTRGFSERSGIAVRLRVPPKLGRFPREIETALFRVVQEALNNVRRHSGSRHAVISLGRTKNGVLLQVRDFGRGMPCGPTSLQPGASSTLGIGIAGMRERLQQLGGELQVYSNPRGTLVRAILPLIEGVK